MSKTFETNALKGKSLAAGMKRRIVELGKYGAKHRWCTPYRHWKFVSTEFRTRLESE